MVMAAELAAVGAARSHKRVHSVELAPHPASVAAARRFVKRLVTDPEVAMVAELLVSELATNAVEHARSPFHVVALVRGGRVHVEVDDTHPLLPVFTGGSVDSDRGRGLWLVDSLADAWGVDRRARGKAVWFDLVCG